jgi:hypothetical protein
MTKWLGRAFITGRPRQMRALMTQFSIQIGLLLWVLYVPSGQAKSYLLPKDGSRLVGYPETHHVEKGEHLEAIAKQYNVGFLALLH